MRKLLCLLTLFLVTPLALASGDDLTNVSKNQNELNVATGTGNSTSFGYGPDNDINDCMAHWSALIITFPKRNKFCERQEFVSWAQAPQFHTLNSIKIMCSDPMGREVFGSTLECISVFTPEGVPTTPPTPGPDDEETRPDAVGEVSECGGPCPDVHDIVQTQMVQHEEEYENLEQRLARIERGNQIASQKAQERRDYAQQTIERLEDESER